MISKELLLEVAKRKGLTSRDQMEKDYFQDIFLYRLYGKTNALVFKGGTALYKLYGLRRFSEDLDFSVVRKVEAGEVVGQVAGELGWEVRSEKRMRDAVLVKLGMRGIVTQYNTLRIDVSLKNVVFKYDVKGYVPEYVDMPPFSMRVLDLKEGAAEKIHSLLSRERARDLYDLFFLLRATGVDGRIVDRKLGLFGMKFDLEEVRRRVAALEERWGPELKPFLLERVPDFAVVREFVLGRLERARLGTRGSAGDGGGR
jgi:predicted nucleotidyltransferase component of viral defense system